MQTTKNKRGRLFIVTWRCPKCDDVSLAHPMWDCLKNNKVRGMCDACDYVTPNGQEDFLIEVWLKERPV